MPDYEPDSSKIRPNPFGFKSDPKEAEDALMENLRAMGRFFDFVGLEPGQIEAAWQRYQDAHERDGILRLAFSIDHVLGVQRDLEAIDSCNGIHDLGRLGSFQILLHIGLIELVEGGGYLSPFDWALRLRKTGDLPDLYFSFPWYAPWSRRVSSKDIQRFLVALKDAHTADRGSANSLVRAMTDGLSGDQKQALLNGWMFSEPYPLGTAHNPASQKHLHCRRRVERWKTATEEEKRTVLPFPNPEPCSRFCKPATSDEVRELFPVFVWDYLYRMRNEVVHAASPVRLQPWATRHS